MTAIGACLMFASCTENENEASGYPTIRISEKTIDIETSEGYTKEITILATRPWSAAAVDSTQKWLIVEPLSGEASDDPQTVTLTVLPNTGYDRSAAYRFNIGFDTKTVTVSQKGSAGSAEDAILYANDFDKLSTSDYYNSKKSWPSIDSLRYWTNETGKGISEMYYTHKGITVRANSNSNGNYSDYAETASGVNNLLFGTDNYLTIKNIKLNGTTNLILKFGSEKYDSNNKDALFSQTEFPIFLTVDGTKWITVTDYQFAGTTAGRWNIATLEFAVPAGTDSLGIGFSTSTSGSYRMDDLSLSASTDEYTALDFTAAVEKDFGSKDDGNDDGGDDAKFVYKKATKITAGKKYVMVADNMCAKNVSSEKSYGYLYGTEVTDKGDSISLSVETNNFIFEETTTAGQYKIKDSYGRYMYMKGTYSSFNFATDPTEGGEIWTVSVDDKGVFTIKNVDKAAWIQWSSSYTSFGAYTTQTGTSPYLYQYDDGTLDDDEDDDQTEYNDETPADAKTVTLEFSTMSFANAEDISGKDLSTNSDVSFIFATGSGSNAPKYYNTGTAARMYSGNTATIAGGKNIRKVVFTFASNNAPVDGGFKTNKGKLWLDHEYTWLGNTTSLVLTNTASSGTWRLQKVVIYYTE